MGAGGGDVADERAVGETRVKLLFRKVPAILLFPHRRKRARRILPSGDRHTHHHYRLQPFIHYSFFLFSCTTVSALGTTGAVIYGLLQPSVDFLSSVLIQDWSLLHVRSLDVERGRTHLSHFGWGGCCSTITKCVLLTHTTYRSTPSTHHSECPGWKNSSPHDTQMPHLGVRSHLCSKFIHPTCRFHPNLCRPIGHTNGP